MYKSLEYPEEALKLPKHLISKKTLEIIQTINSLKKIDNRDIHSLL